MFFLEFELCFRGTFSKMSKKMIKMLILRHQMRQKNRGALFSVTVRPGEGQMGAICLKSPNLPRGFQGVSPWSLVKHICIDLDFCDRSEITKSTSIITEFVASLIRES